MPQENTIPIIDVCGKRTLVYVIDCISKFNIGFKSLKIRAVGMNTVKALEILQILQKMYSSVKINESVIAHYKIEGKYHSYGVETSISIDTNAESKNLIEINEDSEDSGAKEQSSAKWISIPIYHLFFDWLLNETGHLQVFSSFVPKPSKEIYSDIMTAISQDAGLEAKEKNVLLAKFKKYNPEDHIPDKKLDGISVFFIDKILKILENNTTLSKESKDKVTTALENKVLLKISNKQGRPEYTIRNSITASKTKNAFYRCGILMPLDVLQIAEQLSEYDDIILGLDTNILYKCNFTEHIVPALSLVNIRKYVNTPNWILLLVPSAVMQELEKTANTKTDNSKLAFRALQEVIEFNENYDLFGVSAIISGSAIPTMGTTNELEQLRKDVFNIAKVLVRNEEGKPNKLSDHKKLIGGDTIIRDQFKSFLRQIDFHKGTFFVTGDKINSVLAMAEGLQPLYIRDPIERTKCNVPIHEHEFKLDKIVNGVTSDETTSLKINVPIGQIFYELAVQFDDILIVNPDNSDQRFILSCDTNPDNLYNWVHKRLRIEKSDYLKMLEIHKGAFGLPETNEKWNDFLYQLESYKTNE